MYVIKCEKKKTKCSLELRDWVREGYRGSSKTKLRQWGQQAEPCSLLTLFSILWAVFLITTNSISRAQTVTVYVSTPKESPKCFWLRNWFQPIPSFFRAMMSYELFFICKLFLLCQKQNIFLNTTCFKLEPWLLDSCLNFMTKALSQFGLLLTQTNNNKKPCKYISSWKKDSNHY